MRVDGPRDALAEAAAGLPEGPARQEAIAVRLRRRGRTLSLGEPEVVADLSSAIDLFEQWGRNSSKWCVPIRRCSLSFRSAHGSWRACGRGYSEGSSCAPGPSLGGAAQLRISETIALRVAADAAFWRGVRTCATVQEWRRLTTGYSVVLYHRLAGAHEAGEERLDVPPQQFDAQMRLLRWLRLRPLSEDELLDFHAPRSSGLRGRRYLVTVDDALLDTIEPLGRNAASLPLVFVPTAAVGGRAHWLGDRPLADWDTLLGLQAEGVSLGGHSRTHRLLPDLDDATLEDEVEGSLRDLESRLGRAPEPLRLSERSA